MDTAKDLERSKHLPDSRERNEGATSFSMNLTAGWKRQAVIAQVGELGRIIGLEWAKDSSVRKITTADLRRWNEVMATARQSDDGSGQQMMNAMKAVRIMARSR